MKLSSELIQNAVDAFASLPGIGKKTALRLVLHLLKQNNEVTEHLAKSLVDMRNLVKECKTCHNISDSEVCSICADPSRRKDMICIVENIRDLMAIEDTQQYSGQYHVLGGVISPLEGVGPESIKIDSLLARLDRGGDINEIIMAISPTIEGETTIYYITKKVEPFNIKVSTLARGISFGGELEYADGLTLGRSIISRVPYTSSQD